MATPMGALRKKSEKRISADGTRFSRQRSFQRRGFGQTRREPPGSLAILQGAYGGGQLLSGFGFEIFFARTSFTGRAREPIERCGRSLARKGELRRRRRFTFAGACQETIRHVAVEHRAVPCRHRPRHIGNSSGGGGSLRLLRAHSSCPAMPRPTREMPRRRWPSRSAAPAHCAVSGCTSATPAPASAKRKNPSAANRDMPPGCCGENVRPRRPLTMVMIFRPQQWEENYVRQNLFFSTRRRT